jgi:hypothetical protein
MEDEYPVDDAEFYDGLEEDPGKPYQELKLPAWFTGERQAEAAPPEPPAIPSWLHVPADAPPPPKRLMTPEEFRARLAAEGIILPDPPDEPGRVR